MLVVVQVFAWHIVFRNLVCDHLCHIWISRILDTVYGIRFERVAFFCQLLHTFGVGHRGVRNLLSRSPLSSGVRPRFHAFFSITLRHVSSPLSRDLHSVTRSRRISETARSGPFVVDRILNLSARLRKADQSRSSTRT